METADVRRRVRAAMAEARRLSAERRQRIDEANRAWDIALERAVVPAARQLAQVLTAEGVRLQVSTPGERVILTSDHRMDDYVELALDASGDDAAVVVRVNRAREAITEERSLARGAAAVAELDEARVVDALLAALTPWLAR